MPMHRRAVLRAACLALAAGLDSGLAFAIDQVPVRKTFRVSVTGSQVVATVVSLIVTNAVAYVLRDFPNLSIECNGQEVDFLGPMLKRQAYTIEDYEVVSPGREFQSSIDITGLYRWLNCQHEYIASLTSEYVDPTTNERLAGDIASDRFVYHNR